MADSLPRDSAPVLDVCPECGGGLHDPEPWHAHDRPPYCDTCEWHPWPDSADE